MKLGVRAHDFGRREPNELARVIAEAGYETAQLALLKAIDGVNDFPDVTAALLERVRRAFEENRVEIGVLGCYVEIGHPDKDTRLDAVRKYILGLEHAKELGAKLVGTETTRFDLYPASLTREDAYQNLRDSVLRMAEGAEKLGVNIGIEAVAYHTMNTAATTRRLLDEVDSPRLRVIYDTVNLLMTVDDLRGQDAIAEDYLAKLEPYISALHVKDIAVENGEPKWSRIGEGVIRYDRLAAWLNADGRDIPVLREEARPGSYEADLAAMKRLFA